MCTKMEQPFYPDSFFSGYSQEYSKAALKAAAAGMALNLSAEPFRALKPQMPHHPHPHSHHSHHLRGQEEEEGSAVSGGGYFAGPLHHQQPPPPSSQPTAEGLGSSSLKLASPELERLIAQNSHGVITTTPTPPGGPQYYFSPRGATEEQEGFADGFVKALDDLHKMNHLPPPNVSIGAAAASSSASSSSASSSSSSSTVSNGYGAASSSTSSSSSSSLPQEPPPVYTNLTSSSFNPSSSSSSPASNGFPSANLSYLPHPPHPHHPHHALAALGHHHPQHHHPPSRGVFKEEPQTVPEVQSPPVSPINMEDQERIKVERKRLRNRLAATKCRKRKLERIARLEEKVKSLKSDNAGLSSTASALRDQVAQLKQKVMSHVNSGCQLLLTAKMQQHSF